MLKIQLVALAFRMAAAYGFFAPDPQVIATAVDAVLADPMPLFGDRESELAVMLTWAAHESSFRAHAVGDHGGSHGLLQQRLVMPIAEQWRAWLRLLHASTSQCGDVRRGLQAVSGGKCSSVPHLVAARLEEAWLVLELAR